MAPSPTPQCSSYWKGSFLVALEYGRQLYLLFHHVNCYLNMTNIFHERKLLWNYSLFIVSYIRDCEANETKHHLLMKNYFLSSQSGDTVWLHGEIEREISTSEKPNDRFKQVLLPIRSLEWRYKNLKNVTAWLGSFYSSTIFARYCTLRLPFILVFTEFS